MYSWDRNDDDDLAERIRLSFGARSHSDWLDRVDLIMTALGQQNRPRNIWANRTAAYEREWDWRG